MDAFADIRRRLADLERRATQGIRVGTVDKVDREHCRVRVIFPVPKVKAESEEKSFVSSGNAQLLAVVVKQSVGNPDYWMPEIGEQVVCLFPPGVGGAGFVLGSFYADEDPIPEGAATEGIARAVEFSDGARMDYDTENSKGRMLVGDMDVEITPDHVLVKGGDDVQAEVTPERVRLLAGDLEAELTPDLWRMGGSSANQSYVRGEDLQTLIEAILDLDVAHAHPTGVGLSGPPSNAAAYTAKKAQVSQILSSIIKGR